MAWSRVSFLAPVTAALASGCSYSPSAVETHAAAKDVRCLPVNGHRDQVGCWILATHPVAEPAGRMLYWHVYEFANAALASRAKDEHAEMIEAYGRTYLMAVTAEQWSPKGGRHVASIGPLQTVLPVPHTATLLQTWLVPGMQTRVHRHEGPEALMILSGEQCVETPEGHSRARQGQEVLVPAGTPMVLYAVGGGRRALTVIIHPSGQPLSHAHEWHPTGICLGS